MLKTRTHLAARGAAWLLVASFATTAYGETNNSFVIQKTRVFDGVSSTEELDVLVENGFISSIGADLDVPSDTRIIDGRQQTLLPGLIDSHTHSFGNALERTLVFGVTTVIDQFTSIDSAASWRSQQANGIVATRADIFSAGTLATAQGGHGTQYGFPIPTLEHASEADEWVEQRRAEGSDFIKIVIENGDAFARPLPTLSPETVRAVRQAATDRDLLAVAHVSTFSGAQIALGAEVDGLVHLFGDQVADPKWIANAAAAGLFVTPTLSVVASTTGSSSGLSLLEDPNIGPYLEENEASNIKGSFPDSGRVVLAHALETVQQLRQAKVRLLAGTDAPNPGTAHGASMHRELELLVEAGLTPIEALRAATSAPAEAYRLTDRGRIQAGLRADLLLVHGNPTETIQDTRKIAAVFKGGYELERKVVERAPKIPQAVGLVSDFEDGKVSAVSGSWMTSTDQMAGGQSNAELTVVASQDGHVLKVEGELLSGFPAPWAGPMFFPGTPPMTPVDLSSAKTIRFRARSDSHTSLRLMLFAASLGRMPSTRSFTVSPQWSAIELSVGDFAGVDPSGLSGVLWTSGPELGPFSFEIDDVEWR